LNYRAVNLILEGSSPTTNDRRMQQDVSTEVQYVQCLAGRHSQLKCNLKHEPAEMISIQGASVDKKKALPRTQQQYSTTACNYMRASTQVQNTEIHTTLNSFLNRKRILSILI
jgi:hypothetical protein